MTQIHEDDRNAVAETSLAGDIVIPHSASGESECSEEYEDDFLFSDATLTQRSPALLNNTSSKSNLAASALDLPDTIPPEFSIAIPLPNYIKTPSNMKADDLQYLWCKGALRLPDQSLKNALLRSYIDYVHPSLPLINLHQFLAITCAADTGVSVREDQKISLLLFQAVLFAGSAFVDQMSLQMAGYSTRREARAAFYQKIKV